MTELIFSSNPWLLPALMLLVLGLSIEVPYRFGRSLARYMPKADPFNAVQAGLLTLAAFVLALSFNQASGVSTRAGGSSSEKPMLWERRGFAPISLSQRNPSDFVGY